MNSYSFFLNTTPARFNEGRCLKNAINSLLAQSFPPEKVYLCIPYRYKRFPDVPVNAPPHWLKALTRQKKVKILQGNDYGGATRYIYADQVKEEENLTNICSADDDVIYKKDILERVWEFKKEYGLDAASYWSFFWWNKRNDPDDIDLDIRYLQGVDMILTKVDVLKGYFDFVNLCHKEYEDSFLNDDLTLSYYLHLKGCKVSSIENDLRTTHQDSKWSASRNMILSDPAYKEQVTSKNDTRLTDTVGRGEKYHKTFEIINYLKGNYPLNENKNKQTSTASYNTH